MTPEMIAEGARTVAHLAVYLDELKQTAEGLIESGQASRRGYFTPDDEEATRRLQISYWQSRNALFEVVTAYRDDTELAEAQRPDAFLVAYAATVLLVDAARFLREQFEPRPLVRQKLNEPEPSFGIPPGMYDTVQESLTSSRHAWHLYHASRYLERNRDKLCRRACDPLLAPAWNVIERLGRRLDVATARFVRAKLRVERRQAVGLLRYGLLGRALYGLQKLASSLVSEISTRPGHRSCLPQNVAEDLNALLRPGDILITRKEHAATNYFLPGYWKHAALYLGNVAVLTDLGLRDHEHVSPRWSRLLDTQDADNRLVLEALKDGVRIRSTLSPFASDALTVVRPRVESKDVAAALPRGLFHEGKPYDFDFDFTRSDRLVCTEVVYRAFDGIGRMRFELTRRAGRLTLSAEDLVDMALEAAQLEPLAAFSPRHDPNLTEGRSAIELLRAARDEGE